MNKEAQEQPKSAKEDENQEDVSTDSNVESLEEAKEEAAEPTIEEQLAATQEELEKAKNEYLYLRAEFENHKRSAMKERSDYLKYGSERLIVALLEVLDNFDRALSTELDVTNKKSVDGFKKGIEMTRSEFISALKKFGVEEIDCKGAAFDPNLHEALSSQETDEVDPGHIWQVFKAAYKLHERVIRPAQVVVAKEKS